MSEAEDADVGRLTLLPCPFCGEPPREHYGENSKEHWVACDSESCDVCPTTSGGSIESARRAWNRRQSLSQEALRDEAMEERFWVVEAVNEDDTVLSPPAYWYGGFVGSTVAGHVGSDIHAICTRFQNAQTAEYVKCLLRNAKIPPDRGHHWKIFKHVIALKREPNAAAQYEVGEIAGQPGESLTAPAAPDVAGFLEHWIADGHLQTFEDRQRFRTEAAALLAKLGQGWIPVSDGESLGAYLTGLPGKPIYAVDERTQPFSRWRFELPALPPAPGASDD